MNKTHHLCYTCKNARKEETEFGNTIYVSFKCRILDIDHHCVVIRLPNTNHVVECPKYIPTSKKERLLRKWFWRWLKSSAPASSSKPKPTR
jgi:hypothetical protein